MICSKSNVLFCAYNQVFYVRDFITFLVLWNDAFRNIILKPYFVIDFSTRIL